MINNIKKKKTLFYKSSDIWICLILSLTTFAVYLQVTNHEFIVFDDPEYVSENPHVSTGLTIENIVWSITAEVQGNWHPLTLLSHMLDCELYGLNPGPHHLTGLLLHLINTLLLFFLLKQMTGTLWKSAFVAALFALHPLHVESVAWVAERKDVLSSLFWMVTMWCYIKYVERPKVTRYLLVLILFMLGLMTKPMLVTLPFVLLLLDFWPLRRFNPGKPGAWRPVLEKLPLLALSAASSIITWIYQEQGKLVASLVNISISDRIANSLVSYVAYIYKMLWPFGLAVLYPHPQSLPWWQITGAALLLASALFITIRLWNRHPYLTVGWLWYMGTLVPVIGLVQVGNQAMADRYTYIPLIGLFIIFSWGVPDLLERWRYKETALAVTVTVLLSVLATITLLQLRYWHDSTRLLERTLRVTSNNWVTHYNLGAIMAKQGKTAQAANHFYETLRINPNIEEAHLNLGIIKAHQGMTIQAVSHYSAALGINPRLWEAHYHLGIAFNEMGKFREAISHLSRTLQLNPGYPEAYNNMGTALTKLGRTEEAINHFYEALRIDPEYANAYYNLGFVLANTGKTGEAIRHFSESLRLNPGDAEAHNGLGVILANQGRTAEAIRHFSEAVKINPHFEIAQNNLKKALSDQKQEVNGKSGP